MEELESFAARASPMVRLAGNSETKRSGALRSECGGLLGTDQSGDEVIQRGSGADFIIRMRSGPANFAVREQLPREGLAQNEQLHGLAKRYFPIEQGDVLLAPGHIELRFNGVE